MRARFIISNIEDIPSKLFMTASQFVEKYGYHPNDFCEFLGAECNPCISVRYNGTMWHFYEIRQYLEYLKLLRECLQYRAEVVSRNPDLTRAQTYKLFDKCDNITQLKRKAHKIEQEGTPKENIAPYFKFKIIRWEAQKRIW